MKRQQIRLLQERVVLLIGRVQEAEDGNFKKIWQEVGTTWAAVKPIKMTNHFSWGSIKANPLTFRIRMRYFTGHGIVEGLQWHNKMLQLISPPQADVDRCWLDMIAFER